MIPSSKWSNGVKTSITTSATPLADPTLNETVANGIQLMADSGNVSILYIGASGSTADSNNSSGYPLAPGDSIFLPIRHPNEVYIVAKTGSSGKLFYILL